MALLYERHWARTCENVAQPQEGAEPRLGTWLLSVLDGVLSINGHLWATSEHQLHQLFQRENLTKKRFSSFEMSLASIRSFKTCSTWRTCSSSEREYTMTSPIQAKTYCDFAFVRMI